MTELWL